MNATTTILRAPREFELERDALEPATLSEFSARFFDSLLDLCVWGFLALIDRADARSSRDDEME